MDDATGRRPRGPSPAAAATSLCAVTIRSRSSRGSGSTARTPGTARATGSMAAGSPSIATSRSMRWSVPRASSSSGPAATSLPWAKNPTRSHERLDLAQDVRREQDREVALLHEPAEHREQLLHARRVDGDRRLVEDQDGGLLDQRVGDAEALAHAAGVRLGLAVGGVLEADLVEQLVDPGLRDGPGDAVELGGVAQVLAAREAAVEPDVVGQVADLALDRERLAGRIQADDADDAAGRLGEAEQHEHGRRLARAVGPQEAEDLAGVDREVERVDRGEVAVLLGQSPRDDDGVLGDLGQDLGDRPATPLARRRVAGRGLRHRETGLAGGQLRRAEARGLPRTGPARPDSPTSVGRGRPLVGHVATADRTSGRPSTGPRTRPRSGPPRRSTRTAASRREPGSTRRRWPRSPCR